MNSMLSPMKHRRSRPRNTSSKRKGYRFEIKSCRRKKAYFTSKKASQVARYQESVTHDKLRVYRCPFCNKFHITKKPD